jgi:hypothetical protein
MHCNIDTPSLQPDQGHQNLGEYTNIYKYIYIYIHMYIYMYTYIYLDRNALHVYM